MQGADRAGLWGVCAAEEGQAEVRPCAACIYFTLCMFNILYTYKLAFTLTILLLHFYILLLYTYTHVYITYISYRETEEMAEIESYRTILQKYTLKGAR